MGGVPPYTCLWSNGSSSAERISDLVAGVYSLTVHDATNCATSASVTLIEPTQMHLVSITSPLVVGNYNIGCSLTGSIHLTVAGGTPPYNYEWEHGPSTQNVNDLTEPGGYGVLIRDENGAEVRTSITLTRSPEITATATPFVYPNTKNTSCNTCTNGSIIINITSGTAPYTYAWNNGSNAQNPNNLGAGIYTVIITDAAGCNIEKTAILTAPEREDWTMGGNAGILAGQFIGTTDAKDLVFKTNNSEIMRMKDNGKIKLTAGNLLQNGGGALYVDDDGIISTSTRTSVLPCTLPSVPPIWTAFNTSSDKVLFTCPDIRIGIGTYSLISGIKLNVEGRSFFNGNVGFGNNNPLVPLSVLGTSEFIDNAASLNAFEIKGGNMLPSHRGITLDNASSTEGNIKFYVDNDINTNAAFIFDYISNTATPSIPLMAIKSNGTVTINEPAFLSGNNIDSYKLVVGGKLGANEIWVASGGVWPDYVFEKNYPLKPFNELSKYLTENKHLPNLPSASEIKTSDKYNITEILEKQLEKIEESYLYILQLNSKFEALEAKNTELERLLNNQIKK